jgi:hypothetical protein
LEHLLGVHIMTVHQITLSLPEPLYLRLERTAQATRRPLADVLLRAVEVGSPPDWEDAPSEFQADLATLDRLDDDTLWLIARSRQTEQDMTRYTVLLEKNAAGSLTMAERAELKTLRWEADRFMLRKAQAAAILRWRGHLLPPSELL